MNKDEVSKTNHGQDKLNCGRMLLEQLCPTQMAY